MTSPTDLAERLREIRETLEIAASCAHTGLYDGLGDLRWLLGEYDKLADRLSALESAASGAVTDEDVSTFIVTYGRNDIIAQSFDDKAVLAALVTVLGPRLAKAEQLERRVVCPACGVAFDRSSKWARDASSEPAPSARHKSADPALIGPEWIGDEEVAQRMAMDDAKKEAEK